MIQLLQIERKKLKRSRILPILFLFPLGSVLLGRLLIIQMKQTPSWEMLTLGSLISYSTILFPFMIVMVMIVLTRAEHSHSNWKQLLALPVMRLEVYTAKLLMSLLLLLACNLVFLLGLIGTGYRLHMNQLLPERTLWLPFQLLLAALPMIACQFVLSFHTAQVAIPFGIGTFLTLSSLMIGQSNRFWIYDPWTYPMNIALSQPSHMTSILGVCIILFLAIASCGFIYFQKKDIV